jgi:hypothetical protein
MTKGKISEFDQGVLYAAGILACYVGEPTYAADLLKEAGLTDADVSEMDEFDKGNLRSLRGEKGIALKGL